MHASITHNFSARVGFVHQRRSVATDGGIEVINEHFFQYRVYDEINCRDFHLTGDIKTHPNLSRSLEAGWPDRTQVPGVEERRGGLAWSNTSPRGGGEARWVGSEKDGRNVELATNETA